jgi:hypothetical protein
MLFCRPLIIAIWLVWSIQHLVQQNVGILLLYHNPKENEAIVNRKTESLSTQIPAVFFTLMLIRRTTLTGSFLLLDIALIAVGLYALYTVCAYLNELKKQINEGKALSVPAFAFWGMSAMCLLPMGFIGRDFSEGFVAPVTWHWFQYIGLNWRLIRNKYNGGSEDANLPFARPVMLFLVTCATIALINVSLSFSTHTPGISPFVHDCIIGLLIGLVNIHYFLDAFIWKFREPYPRQAILPYLITRSRKEKSVDHINLPENSELSAPQI